MKAPRQPQTTEKSWRGSDKQAPVQFFSFCQSESFLFPSAVRRWRLTTLCTEDTAPIFSYEAIHRWGALRQAQESPDCAPEDSGQSGGGSGRIRVKIWYAGLESVELNLARVKARVAKGGHNIPEADIRKRWDSSRRNLIKLLPHLHSLRLYDNSHEADPGNGYFPMLDLLLHVEAKEIVGKE